MEPVVSHIHCVQSEIKTKVHKTKVTSLFVDWIYYTNIELQNSNTNIPTRNNQNT